MRKITAVLIVLFLSTLSVFSQEKITGKVTDANGAPLGGITVKVKGTNAGTSTASDGSFSVSGKSDATLEFSGIGFETRLVKASGGNVMVGLARDTKSMNEVVVTALGISRQKKALNYSAQTVGSESISTSGKSNLVDALNGKVSGVQITNSANQAGSGTTIVIRGYNSLTGDNQPLYVVDGVPIDNTSEQGANGGSYPYAVPSANRAIDISPDDIESVTVLKGGAATALYGSAASNGALIITTKKGKSGKNNIEVGYGFSSAKANKFIDFNKDYMRGSNGIYNFVTSNNWGPLASTNPVFPAGEMDLLGTGTPQDVTGQKIPFYPNNFENFFVTGLTNKYNIAISGGNDKSTFYTAISRLDQDGIIRNNTYDKTSAIANVSNQVTSRLKLGAKFNYINTGGHRYDAQRIADNLNYYLNTFDIVNYPYETPYGTETYWQPSQSSPMWTVNKTGEDYRINRYITNLDVNYKLAKEWDLSYKVGVDNYAENRRRKDPIGTQKSDGTTLGNMDETRVNSLQVNYDLILNFDHAFNNDFHLHAFAGQNLFFNKYDVLDITGTAFVQPDLYEITNTKTQTIYHSSYRKQKLGVYGDLQLSYKDFLYLEGTLRNDWSSTLPRNDNHFAYPSVSLGFVFTDFVKQDWLSYGKLRASYAGTANDAPVNALATTYSSATPSVFGNPRYSYGSTVGNPKIKNERTNQSEVGLDLGFFKRKIFLEATYYSKRSFDQIIYAPTSLATGVYSQLINLGETTNKGIDATLTFKDVINKKGFSWTSAFNFSRNVSNVVKVGENGNDQVPLLFGYYTTTEMDAQKGQPFGAIYGYAWKRYGVTESDPNYLKAPLLLVDDGAGGLTPVISDAKTLLGNTNPDFILGWDNSFSYKGITFGFTMEWRKGGDVVNDYNYIETYSGKSALTKDRYYPGDPIVNKTRTFVGVDETGKPATSERQLTKSFYTTEFVGIDENFVEDASWLRLRNIYLGYSLPASILKRIHLKGVEFTLAGRNVWLSTKYTGVDPEVSSAGSGPNGVVGFDANGLPATKSFDFGVKIKL